MSTGSGGSYSSISATSSGTSLAETVAAPRRSSRSCRRRRGSDSRARAVARPCSRRRRRDRGWWRRPAAAARARSRPAPAWRCSETDRRSRAPSSRRRAGRTSRSGSRAVRNRRVQPLAAHAQHELCNRARRGSSLRNPEVSGAGAGSSAGRGRRAAPRGSRPACRRSRSTPAALVGAWVEVEDDLLRRVARDVPEERDAVGRVVERVQDQGRGHRLRRLRTAPSARPRAARARPGCAAPRRSSPRCRRRRGSGGRARASGSAMCASPQARSSTSSPGSSRGPSDTASAARPLA